MTGQTGSHGAAPQCWHIIGALRTSVSPSFSRLCERVDAAGLEHGLALADPAVDAQPRHLAHAARVSSSPTSGMLFST